VGKSDIQENPRVPNTSDSTATFVSGFIVHASSDVGSRWTYWLFGSRNMRSQSGRFSPAIV
jgi:hypothetical protein